MKKIDVVIDHRRDLTLDDIERVARHRATVVLAPETEAMLDQRRKQVVDYVHKSKEPAYGFNRGFGHNVDIRVSLEDASMLQQNLILSHSVGVGELTPNKIVRSAMLLRAQSLARGFSGVRSIIVKRLLEMLNKDIVPCVPRLGSVSASGDLAPMSHIALTMIGQGRVQHNGTTMDAENALRKSGLSPIKLEMKEGLALNNGVQFTTAIGLHAYVKIDILLKTACIVTALSTQVMLGSDTPFRPDLHKLRPHPGAVKAARWIFKLMANSPIREAHRPYNIDGEIQDPYNIRCAAQILGACAELIDEAGQALLREANSVTDNPLILEATAENGWDTDEKRKYLGQYIDIVSGGHFHGMPVAIRVYNLFQAMGIMASLSNLRCARYVDEARNKGLGSDLKWPGLSEREKENLLYRVR